MWIEAGLGALLFAFFWWMLSNLLDKALGMPGRKSIHWMLLGCLNAGVAFALFVLQRGAFLPSILLVAMMLVELRLLYKRGFLRAALGYREKNEALEQAILQEQQFRDSMVRDAFAFYEVNLTQDTVLRGFEGKCDETGRPLSSYGDMIQYVARTVVYAEDAGTFLRQYAREYILLQFARGQTELQTDYRRILEDETYAWVRATINVMRDDATEDVKAFICIKNIDEEKCKQLELQRLAECDPLTGVYNKARAANLIEDFLALDNGAQSAFFMIDVDNFKDINDHLSHVFGDAVLCELAEKLVKLFHSDDIVGRIGGDEFSVFLKNCADEAHAQEMAEKICRAFHVVYNGVDGAEYSISSSIGIAFSPRHGANFLDLYACADTALYEAKNSGKNTHRVYDGGTFQGYDAQRTEIQNHGSLSQKGFRQNRVEYIFKMLYQSENHVAAIHSALELVASHFSFERGYIFETSKDGKTTSNTFEWCAPGIVPQRDNLQNIPIEIVAIAHESFQEKGIFIVKSIDTLRPIERDMLEPQGIKSMFQFGIFDKTQLLGFIGFDNCISESVPVDAEIDELATICNILATFFVKQYVDETTAKELLVRQEIVNHMDSYIYVTRSDNFEILFMNDKIKQLRNVGQAEMGCYSFFRGKSEQCEDCPMHKLSQGEGQRIVSEIYNEQLNIWMEVTASTLRWTDGSMACLVNCSDITQQKNAQRQHVEQLETLAYTDELTGYRSYYKFKQDAQRILKQQGNLRHLLVKFDIDNFKLINQMYGYERGDEVLRCVAKAMNETTRNKDEIFARITNDEFIALFTIRDTSETTLLQNTFMACFYALMGKGFTSRCRFSNGRYIIEPSDAHRTDVNEMFEKVNIAHKTAKLDKKVGSVIYDESLTQEALRVKEIEDTMTQALEQQEFVIYLQPKYYLENDTIGGAEALVRWNSENPATFLPGAFISVFERNGFILELDFYVFRKVCEVVKGWRDAGISPVVVSVNFSRLHLGSDDFVARLCSIADRFGVPHCCLEVEITETALYDCIDEFEELLRDLHENGFSMSMDDFGSGYSSLSMLKDLPVDVIKLDKSFMTAQGDAERIKTVVRNIIRMASELGIRTLAEGVEDQEHIDLLRTLRCDMVQGYYFARPMPVDAFTERLQEEREANDACAVTVGSLHT